MKKLKRIISGSPLEGVVRFILNKPKVYFDESGSYWDQRYSSGGNSGSGSYGRLADFKAEILNGFVAEKKIQSIIEFGCGDGNQLSLANYPRYLGIDVSEKAISLCKDRFSSNKTVEFLTLPEYDNQSAELALSLDVIFHLIEDEVYHDYMDFLFKSAERFVIVYSSNSNEINYVGEHVKHRNFTDWVRDNAKSFSLLAHIPNIYPYDEKKCDTTSFADFYIFEKTG